MAIGPLRGGGSPPLKPLTEKPREAQADVAPRVLEKAVDGVLEPGRHLLLPAGTGLAHFRDHFDARGLPGYEKLLKGEAPDPQARSAVEPAPLTAHQQAVMAGALGVLERLPLGLGNLEPDDEPPSPDAHAPRDLLPPVRVLELQGGLFTLEEGSLDVQGRRLCTLEAFLDGDVHEVSVAADLSAIPSGTRLRIPALEAALGREIAMRVVHQTERTEETGTALVEICVSAREARWAALLERLLTVELG